MIEGFTETPATSNEFSIVALYAHAYRHCDSGKLTEFSSLKDDVFFLEGTYHNCYSLLCTGSLSYLFPKLYFEDQNKFCQTKYKILSRKQKLFR